MGSPSLKFNTFQFGGSSCTLLGCNCNMRRCMRVHYVYCMCLCVSVCERGRVCECVSVCAVKLGIQSGCWISVVIGTRQWRLVASFPATLCNQTRPIWRDLIILERLVDISFDSTQRGEEEGREEGRVKRRGAGCDVCVKWEVGRSWWQNWSERILRIQSEKKRILRHFWNFQRWSFNGIPCRSKGQCSAYEAPTYWREISKPLLSHKKIFLVTASTATTGLK